MALVLKIDHLYASFKKPGPVSMQYIPKVVDKIFSFSNTTDYVSSKQEAQLVSIKQSKDYRNVLE